MFSPLNVITIEPATRLAPKMASADFVTDTVRVVKTDGRTAAQLEQRFGQPVIVCDVTAGPEAWSRIAFAASKKVSTEMVDRFVASVASRGAAATRLPDWPGLVVMRTVAMLANEAFEAALQGVATEADIDVAMRHGVNYPKGPIEWARDLGLSRVLAVLDNIHALTGDPRYRASFGLRVAAQE